VHAHTCLACMLVHVQVAIAAVNTLPNRRRLPPIRLRLGRYICCVLVNSDANGEGTLVLRRQAASCRVAAASACTCNPLDAFCCAAQAALGRTRCGTHRPSLRSAGLPRSQTMIFCDLDSLVCACHPASPATRSHNNRYERMDTQYCNLTPSIHFPAQMGFVTTLFAPCGFHPVAHSTTLGTNRQRSCLQRLEHARALWQC
jgi:hypothetical protein